MPPSKDRTDVSVSVFRIHIHLQQKGNQESSSSHPNRSKHTVPADHRTPLTRGLTGSTRTLFQEKSVPVRPLPPQPDESPTSSGAMTVIAEYNYTPMTDQDLELRKEEEYTIIEKSDTNWWRARDQYG